MFDQIFPFLQLQVDFPIYELLNNHNPLIEKLAKIGIYEGVNPIFVDSIFPGCIYVLSRAWLYYLHDKKKNIG